MFKWFGKVNFSPFTKVTDFAQYLKDGRLMGSKCKKCGATSFPPRADCHQCLASDIRDLRFHNYTGLLLLPFSSWAGINCVRRNRAR